MNDRPPVNQEEFEDAANRLVADALLSAAKMSKDGLEMTQNATFMVLIAHVAVRACIFMARGQKAASLKAADLLHRQIVSTLNKSKTKGDNDATT